MVSAQCVMDNNLALLSDEELVRLYREGESRPALGTLVMRHYVRMRRLVKGWAKKERLGVQDRQDLGQEAFLFLLKVVSDYRSNGAGAIKSCRFRTFLGFKIHDWFRNAVRRLRRHEQHIARMVRAEDVLKNRAGPMATTDPEQIAIQREVWERIDAVLFSLEAPLRRLWEEQELGHALHDCATALARSYDHVKRMRRQVFVLLRCGLKEEPD
jgi:DNA-directed RNA polymerase specialized sigma24 family protein